MTLQIVLARKEHFCASHRLYNPDCDEEWNRHTYGPCSNPNGHGHNYFIEVYVAGITDPLTGMVMNLTDLKKILQTVILDNVDHKHLNLDVPFLQGIIPTTENVANAFWKELDPHFPNGSLKKLVLHETDKNWVEISR
ncbi:MAG: 6-carboxytetrahydropterin synthase [Parachlamydiaceae bacterium]|nr:6-carboxytetrahydropterin synthase [Parachlamydiaceae bacterium]